MDKKADQLRKKAIKDQQKRIKPGECQKYVRLVLDSAIVNTNLGKTLLNELKSLQLKYVMRDLREKNCILWERSVGQRLLLPDDVAGILSDEWQLEDQLVNLLHMKELQNHIANGTLATVGVRLHAAYNEMHCTILLLNDKIDKTAKQTTNKTNAAIIELQVLHKLNLLQMPENAYEIAAQLRRYTKSIAEAPYKQQKTETLVGFKKYLANDKKQCVRVVGREGLTRLWQQHLNRLPMVTLEVAETIIAQYSCPKKLLDEFECNPNAVNTLADLKISRSGGGPLQTDRRIGNVLSTKLHTIYSTRDPNTLI